MSHNFTFSLLPFTFTFTFTFFRSFFFLRLFYLIFIFYFQFVIQFFRWLIVQTPFHYCKVNTLCGTRAEMKKNTKIPLPLRQKKMPLRIWDEAWTIFTSICYFPSTFTHVLLSSGEKREGSSNIHNALLTMSYSSTTNSFSFFFHSSFLVIMFWTIIEKERKKKKRNLYSKILTVHSAWKHPYFLFPFFFLSILLTALREKETHTILFPIAVQL